MYGSLAGGHGRGRWGGDGRRGRGGLFPFPVGFRIGVGVESSSSGPPVEDTKLFVVTVEAVDFEVAHQMAVDALAAVAGEGGTLAGRRILAAPWIDSIVAVVAAADQTAVDPQKPVRAKFKRAETQSIRNSFVIFMCSTEQFYYLEAD